MIYLSDVVAAYKSVVKEKEALEASFTALSSAAETTPSHVATNETNKEGAKATETVGEAEGNQSVEDPLGVNKKVRLILRTSFCVLLTYL